MTHAVIWGASGGIGQALVDHLKDQQWTVYAAARQTERVSDRADAVYTFDASQPQSFQETAYFIGQQTETVDLVVYAAGNVAYQKLDRMDAADFAATLDSNLTGAYLAAQAMLPLLRKGGHLVYIGAYVDHLRLPKMGAYAAAKAGLAELVAVLQKENRRHNISLVRPGAVDTPFWEQVSFSKPDDAKAPSVVAEAILARYASDDSGSLDL